MTEVRVRAWRVGQSPESQYLLVLRDDAENVLPMVIGPCEALAIWSVMHRDQVELPKPMTHDLIQNLIEKLGGRLVKVLVDDLWNGVYYARLYLAVDGEVLTVDARPSDAIAVALRMDAPLFASESVMTSALEDDVRDDVEDVGPDAGRDLEGL
jgi:bifunctional DNase/RNase